MKRSLHTWVAMGLLAVTAASAFAVTADEPYLGDVDRDGKVTIRDAIVVLRSSVGLSQINSSDFMLADLYPLQGVGKRPIGDGQITSQDAVSVMTLALGKSISLQAASPMTISTIAGSAQSGFSNTPGQEKFSSPTGVAVDYLGSVYVADRNNHCIRKITTDGDISTLAGSATSGTADGVGSAATFAQPNAIAVSPAGDIYVLDSNKLRRISQDGTVVTVAGNTAGYAEGTGTAALFNDPRGLTVDSMGYVYIADTGNNLIRRVSPVGVTTTYAGSSVGSALSQPTGVAVDSDGYLYVTDTGANRIRRINLDQTGITLAGATVRGNLDGVGLSASFNLPQAIAIDTAKNLYVADTNNYTIRLVLQNGTVSTIAGMTKEGFSDGLALNSALGVVQGITTDSSGNVYIADETNNRIRRLTTQ